MLEARELWRRIHEEKVPVSVLAKELGVRDKAIYSALSQVSDMLSSTDSIGWIRRPLCESDWREFVEIQNDPESE